MLSLDATIGFTHHARPTREDMASVCGCRQQAWLQAATRRLRPRGGCGQEVEGCKSWTAGSRGRSSWTINTTLVVSPLLWYAKIIEAGSGRRVQLTLYIFNILRRFIDTWYIGHISP